MKYAESVLRIFREIFSKADKVLISTHVNPDADAIGSVIAASEMLSQLDIDSEIILERGCPPKYTFLKDGTHIHGYADWQNSTDFKHALILDCGNLERIGEVEKLLAKDCYIANIDHHISNTNFGSLNLVDSQCAATGEILFLSAKCIGIAMNRKISNCLYSAILTDTGRFRYSNTTAQTMTVVSELIESGAEFTRMTDKLFYDLPQYDVLSIGKIYSSLEMFDDGRVSTLFVKRENLVEDPDSVVDIALSIRGVEVAAMFSETPDNKIRISLRSKHYVNVSEIAETFGGGGHTRAAGCRMMGTLQEARDKILPAIIESVSLKSTQTSNMVI